MGKSIPMSEMCEGCIHEKVCCLMVEYKKFYENIQAIVGLSPFKASVFCDYHEYKKEK